MAPGLAALALALWPAVRALPSIPSNCSYVPAATTSRHIRNFQSGHYACRPMTSAGAPQNQLCVFLPGTSTIDYTSLPKVAGEAGFHAISLDWINHPNAGSACCIEMAKQSPQCNGPHIPDDAVLNCTHDLELARLVGGTSPAQNVSQPDSIVGRTVALLGYLRQREPERDWGQFLLASGQLNWAKITFGGHSRGSSYPPMVAKLFRARRTFSVGGIADHWGSTLPNATASEVHAPPWLVDEPNLMDDKDIYALNPGFEGTLFKAVDYYAIAKGRTGNATFTRAQAASADLSSTLGGARLLWDSEICANTSSPHMCIGTCDGWQPVDHNNRPLLAPVRRPPPLPPLRLDTTL